MNRTIYGFRYFSGRDTTTGDRGYIAGELVAFKTKDDATIWLYYQDRFAPAAKGGGDRILCSRAKALKLVGSKQVKHAKEMLEV